ncbi:MAG: hypothetical protein HOO06_03110 [Bdellovibrionaceae bacterium]|jgi:sulfur-carrier protein adenylyltransferase/sulfurtransferase|nr:hypothetical protein [Pseudobdellovibrionaceae bacterium]
MGTNLCLFLLWRGGKPVFMITDKKIDIAGLKNHLSNTQAGALVVFEGLVRDHNEGFEVKSLEYEIFKDLALKEGEVVLDEAMERFNITDAVCVHREGHLQITDEAVWIGVTSKHRADAFKACSYIIDEIKLRLPIWKKEHYVDQPAQWVDCKGCYHHTEVQFSEIEYYAKQSYLPSMQEGKQQLLKKSKVLVVGAGGLGSPVLTYLATAGVGHITIVDHDNLEVSNLHRQALYGHEDLGQFKADLAKKRLKQMNPFVHLKALTKKIDLSNVKDLVSEHDVVVDCTDNFSTKFLVHDACYLNKTPLVQASIYQQEGQLQVYLPESSSGCMRCLWPELPEAHCVGSCIEVGVLGASVGVIGSLQALEVIEYLLKHKTQAQSKTILVNLPDLDVLRINRTKNSKCVLCSSDSKVDSKISKLEPVNYMSPKAEFELSASSVTEAMLLEYNCLDVRSLTEVHKQYLKLSNKKNKYLLVCQQGIGSYKIAKDLRGKGFDNFYSLRGGIKELKDPKIFNMVN